MFNKIIGAVKPISKMLLIIGSFVFLAIFGLTHVVTINGDFFSVMAGLIITTVGIIALAVTPVFLILKKDNIAKIAFTILGGYWVISTLLSEISSGYNFDVNNPGIFNAASIFSFILGIVLLAIVVLIVLSIALKKDIFKVIAMFGVLSFIFLALVAGILWICCYASNPDFYVWTDYVGIIGNYFVLPTVVTFGVLYFYY